MEELIELLSDVSSTTLIDLMRDMNSYDGSFDGDCLYENGEDFFEVFYAEDIDGAVRAVCYGDYTYTDEYVRINAYGNLDTFSEYEVPSYLSNYIDEIADKLVNCDESELSSFISNLNDEGNYTEIVELVDKLRNEGDSENE